MLTAFSGTQSGVFLKNSAYGFRADLRIRKFSFSKTDKNLLIPSKVALLLELRLY